MKQFLFLTAAVMVGGTAAITAPFWGVMLYYALATLRPQNLWAWALADMPTVRWSLLAGGIAIGAFLIHLPTIINTARTNKVLGLLLIYAVLITLSVLTAFNPKVAQFWLEEYAKVIAIAVIASLVVQQLWQVRALGIMIALSIGYIALEINHLYFTQGGRLDILHDGYGGLDNNGAGTLIALGIPFAYFLAISRVGNWAKPRRVLGICLGLLMLHSVMMTYSRGAMLATAVGIGWILFHHRPRKQAVAAGFATMLVVAVMAGPEIRNRFVSTAEFQTDASAQSRFESWGAAWRMAWDNPILGKGIRNSNTYSENFGADMAGRTIHNQYLQLAADSGIPAALVYILLLLIGLWGVYLARRRILHFHSEKHEGLEDEQHARLEDAAALTLALQAALLMFMFSAMFLSVELVELPWLLIVLAGVTPMAVMYFLDAFDDEIETQSEQADAPTSSEPPPPALSPAQPAQDPQRRAA
ncbi:MAG: O-antigen ligase family protein [Phycisphaerales bacterium JB063]